jgi:hypothetical protein
MVLVRWSPAEGPRNAHGRANSEAVRRADLADRQWFHGVQRIVAATREWLLPGLVDRATDYIDALRLRAAPLRGPVAALFAEADVLHLPVLPVPVPTIAEAEVPGGIDYVAFAYPSRAINLMGLPVLALPMGVTRNGLPAGMQLVGWPWPEERLLAPGARHEATAGFAWRVPSNVRPAPLGMRAILRHAGGRARLRLASLRRTEDVAMLAPEGCDTFRSGRASRRRWFGVPRRVQRWKRSKPLHEPAPERSDGPIASQRVCGLPFRGCINLHFVAHCCARMHAYGQSPLGVKRRFGPREDT